MTSRRGLFAILLAPALLAAPPKLNPTQTQSYPRHPVWLYAPQAPGGPTDLLAHAIAQRLQAAFGQRVFRRKPRRLLRYRRRARGRQRTARRLHPAMGNTSTLVLVPMLSQAMSYDPTKLFAPVARVAESYQVLVVNPSLPVNSVAALVAYARRTPAS
jgi:tripartite-type tricarboxylate transporter receptor subunit TctC